MRRVLALLCAVLPLSATAQPRSGSSSSALCETAIGSAEHAARLPPRLLGAIGTTESGRLDAATGVVRPWPWTINAEGVGQYFTTKSEAIASVKALQARGVRSIDIGCMQVNLSYHPSAFSSLDEAFDPRANAAYAARFLNALYAASGNWMLAIGSYHSETPALGAAYRSLVAARWERADPAFRPPTPVAYRAFEPAQQAYGAFASSDRVYAAFAGQGQARIPALPAPRR
jgi:hypothetical protein